MLPRPHPRSVRMNKSLRAACEAYVKAVNAGDATAVAKLWADDADYVNDSGDRYKGRTAIEKLFKDQLPTMKGKKFSFDTQSLKFIAPGVAVEDGIAKYTGGDEDEKQPGRPLYRSLGSQQQPMAAQQRARFGRFAERAGSPFAAEATRLDGG